MAKAVRARKSAVATRLISPMRGRTLSRRLRGVNASNLPRRQFLHLATGAAALPAVSRMAKAQTYPARPVTIVVPYAPGGATDVIARNLAERMKSFLGQPVIIENVTGAGGTIAVGRVARAAPDGYTLSLGQNASHVTTGAIYPHRYDLLTDFEPVGLLATTRIYCWHNAMPADDLKGFIAWLKANPDKVTQGIGGVGGTDHIGGILLQKETAPASASCPIVAVPRSCRIWPPGRSTWRCSTRPRL